MKKTLAALLVAAGAAGFAGSAYAGCAGHTQTVQSSSKPMVTADAEQSTPVVKTSPAETAKN
jgi:hypothetical protein